MHPILLQLCAPPARPASAVKQGLLCPLSVISHHCTAIQAWLQGRFQQGWFEGSDLSSVRSATERWKEMNIGERVCVVGRCWGGGGCWGQINCDDCVSLSPRWSAVVRRSSASRATLFWTLSQDSAVKQGWTKKNDSEGARPPSITHQQNPPPPTTTPRMNGRLAAVAPLLVACCQAPWIKPVWLCGLCQTRFAMSVCIAADGDLKAGPAAAEIARRRAAFHVCSLPLLFVFIVLLLSPSIPQPGVNKKKKRRRCCACLEFTGSKKR